MVGGMLGSHTEEGWLCVAAASQPSQANCSVAGPPCVSPQAKDAAGGLVEGANAGLQKAREEAQRLWDSFQKKDEEGGKKGGSKKSGHEEAAAEL